MGVLQSPEDLARKCLPLPGVLPVVQLDLESPFVPKPSPTYLLYNLDIAIMIGSQLLKIALYIYVYLVNFFS